MVKVQVKVPVSNKLKIEVSESKIGTWRDTIIKYKWSDSSRNGKKNNCWLDQSLVEMDLGWISPRLIRLVHG